MRKKYGKQLMAWTLACCLSVSLFPVQTLYAENPKGETSEETAQYERIEIATPEEFAEFAKNCHINAWSENKYVCLQNDIDLTGRNIEPVAVFGGIFDGAGHTISGFHYIGDGYVSGLFRYVASGGTVQNLMLKGSISAENEKECVGSICGVNYGTIKGCTFQGTVSGRDTVGGIAGINENTGTITDCMTKGRVTGYYATGGITGRNHGVLNACTNHAGINDDSAWVEEDDEMGGILQTLTSGEDADLYSGVDTGGIVGYSDGMISGCTNRGTVGYEHTGYNIGGIAGRQAGIVSMSMNYGTVYGRKDVGGIVGQMEPFIEMNEAASLRDAVNKLHDLIAKTIDDMQAAKNVVKTDVDIMQTFADYAIDAGDMLADQLADFTDKNIAEFNSVTQRMEHVMDLLPDVFDRITAAGNGMTGVHSILKKVTEDLEVLEKLDDSAYDGTDSRVTLLSTAGGTVISSRMNPEANEEVTLTIKPEDGYTLKEDAFTVRDAAGNQVDFTKAGMQYTFRMPRARVIVSAAFVYTGTFLVESNEGGNISSYEKDGVVTYTAIPSEGYTFGRFLVDGVPYPVSSSNTIELRKEAYAFHASTVSVRAEFEKKASFVQTERIWIASSTGGGVFANPVNAKDGDIVYLTAVAKQGYVLQKLQITNTTQNDSAISYQLESSGERYSFVMPDNGDQVQVTALFIPLEVVVSSNVSGSVSFSGNTIGTVTLSVRPDSSYIMAGTPSVTDAGGQQLPVTGRLSGGVQLYDFSVGNAGAAPYHAVVSFQKQSNKQAVDAAKQGIQDAVNHLDLTSGKVQETVQKIKDLTGNQSWDSLTPDVRNEIRTELIHLSDYIGEMAADAAAILGSLTAIYNILTPYAIESAQAAKNDLKRAIDEMQSVVDSLRAANNGMKGIVNYLNAQSDVRFEQLGEGFDATKENFHNQLKAMSDSIQNLSDNASAYSDVVNNDLRAVNDQLNVVFNLLADRMVEVERLDIEALYEDVSDEEIDTITTGRADACTNKGIVKGDINVGGIAGAMAIDDEDLEGNAAGSVEYAIGRRFITKCLVTNSVNEGYITAKKDGAGGIAGYMNHGIIIDSEGYGSVESTEGGFVGGICGESLTIIRRCYALCSVSGISNVGGIAGFAGTLKECYAMVDVDAENGRAGAIAGQIAAYEEVDVNALDNEPRVLGNYYVGEDLNGIDNVSYSGVAEPIRYSDLLELEQLPTQFRHLNVIYKIEDRFLGAQEVAYGSRLNSLNFPQIPPREGYYGVWPDVSDRIMTGTMVIEAEYRDNVTVIQSSSGASMPAADTTIHKPYALVEDIFTDSTVLRAVLSGQQPPQEIGAKECVVYEVSLENSGIQDTDSFALRILNPFADALVYEYGNEGWTEIAAKERGQYLQVMMTGTKAYFCVAEHTPDTVRKIEIAAAAVLLLCIVLLSKKLLSCRKKKKQKKSEQPSMEDGTKQE